jgi:hypothetical protein
VKPRDIRQSDLDYWADYDAHATVIGGPPSEPDCIPCPALVTTSEALNGTTVAIRVPYELDEIELAHLARGGTLWLTTWGGLPIHMLEVQAP